MKKQLNIKGIITATSHKQSDKFATQNPRKSVYLKLDEANAKRAKEFGMQEYTSKNGESFFILKASELVKLYNQDGLHGTANGNADDDSNNWTSGDKEVGLAIFRGENKGNVFLRLFAIQGELEEVQPENPFLTDLPF